MTEYKKKLIEVALPLEVINRESAHEKSIRHGHPSALHHWWARRPLAACRAVLFASLVDDPSANPELFPTEEDQESERQRLFRIIENLVKWENSTDETVLAAARAEIMRSTNGNPPPVLDPFCGAGSIPLEAQRLGLDAHGSDLNPVAVLITKALIEVPPKFAGLPAVNPNAQAKLGRGDGEGVQGLADDVRYYGAWMRDEAEKRIGDLYPRVVLPQEAGGGEAAVIAWIWARTVRCPNPACGADMPLVRSFVLSTKKGKQAWVEPIVDSVAKTVGFRVVTGSGVAPESPKMGRGAKFRCLVCGDVADERHIKDEGCAGRMGAQLIAVVAEGRRGRVYLSPTLDIAEHALQANPTWKPDFTISGSTQYLGVKPYGMDEFSQLFTNRQLVALNTLSDLVVEARERVVKDAVVRGFVNDAESFAAGGTGATAYADAVALFLAFALDKQADLASSLCAWEPIAQCPRHVFGRQAIPMVWDYAEGNPLGSSSGAWVVCVEGIARAFERAFEHVSGSSTGRVEQLDATRAAFMPGQLVSTDPPYYDNVPYADLPSLPR